MPLLRRGSTMSSRRAPLTSTSSQNENTNEATSVQTRTRGTGFEIENPTDFLREKLTDANGRKSKTMNKENSEPHLIGDQVVFPKPTASPKSPQCQQSLDLTLSDFSCPICLEVLFEPVRFPCNHEVCLPCFKDMTEMTNFLCPICRMRISTWSRTHSNSLVDMKRWKEVKQAFPTAVQNRIEGKTATLLAEQIETEKKEKAKELEKNSALISKSTAETASATSGETHNEYVHMLRIDQKKLRLEKEKEEKASLAYIQQLLLKEEKLSMKDYISRVRKSLTSCSECKENDIPTSSSASASSSHPSTGFQLKQNQQPRQTNLRSSRLISRPSICVNNILTSRPNLRNKPTTSSSTPTPPSLTNNENNSTFNINPSIAQRAPVNAKLKPRRSMRIKHLNPNRHYPTTSTASSSTSTTDINSNRDVSDVISRLRERHANRASCDDQ